MAGELRKEEEIFESENASKQVMNPEIKVIISELSRFY